MTPTLRRLNDKERYYGLAWPGEWLTALAAGAVMYATVRLSPFGLGPTVILTVILLGFAIAAVAGLSGQALSPGRWLVALWHHWCRPRLYVMPDRPDRRRGLVLDAAPPITILRAETIPAGEAAGSVAACAGDDTPAGVTS
ncbi:MAG: hypothetical protein ABSG43_01055 [Solirubrobacteraceae bacterium]|jgi:hypothetical protein